MKNIAIISIVVVGLLSLTLINNAFANEAAFRAVEGTWHKIELHKSQQFIQTSNSTHYKTNTSTSNGFSNLGYDHVNGNVKQSSLLSPVYIQHNTI